jgi:lysozyme
MFAAPTTYARAAAGCLIVACLCGCGPTSPFDRTEWLSEAIQQCAGSTVEGIDIYDGTGSVTWSSVKAAGIDFAIIKATQGTYNSQSTFPSYWSGAKGAGLVRSAYHFFDPTEDGVAQAQHFLSVVGSLAADDLPPMLDIECPDGSSNCLGTGASGATPAATIHQRMWDWINTVAKATGKAPLIYSYGSYFSSNGIDTTGLAVYPLNIADVTTASCFNVPSPWQKAAIWQYSWTGSVSGISAQVDRDRFLGNLSDLQAFARGGAPAGQNESTDAMASPADAHAEGGQVEAGGASGTDGSLGSDTGHGGSSGAAGGSGGTAGGSGGAADAQADIEAATRNAADAGDGARATAGQGKGGGCGCRVVATRGNGELQVALVTSLLTAIARRRRRLPPAGLAEKPPF